MTETYHAINLPGLLPGNQLQFDLFVHFKGQYLCFRKEKSSLSPDLLDKLQRQKISALFIQSHAMKKYHLLMKTLLDQVLEIPADFSDEKKVDVLSAASSSSLRQMAHDPKDGEAYMMSCLTSRGMIELLLRDSSHLKTFFNVPAIDNDLFIHSRNVALLAAALGRKMGLKVETMLHLAIAGLLHDLGVMRVTAEERKIFYAPADSLTKEQKKIYAKHAKESEEMLQQNTLIPHSVLELISVHECTLSEWPDMSSAAQVLALVNLFDKSVSIDKVPPALAFKNLKIKQVGNFHVKMINALGEVLKQAWF
ncbi:MAG: hypothetical protein A2X86_10575 [Bdellovibrionales bacterium GWA2_49_15]|nr:MAG: hypothetical protein A2X86_10575 [Bdellovibrionales bacterium GWA2_49_15]HAZ11419.1 hypothetical protein [Bdellovibrionales bacterium]